ncbi:MAG: aldehyde dehydrogenase family protein [Chitinophagales bacterium]|jgi:aldehyde dehydrogenase (NAD+)|nr:aldehyde dehydrogenase family protein [Chitinophagales bacterium]
MNSDLPQYKNQLDFFASGKTLDINYRIQALKKIKQALNAHQSNFEQAIYQDFGKSPFSTEISEISLLHHELDYYISHLPKLSKAKKVKKNAANLLASHYIVAEPFGVTLILGAWNYPFLLTLNPMIAAIAAGNTAIIKPSEQAPHAMEAIKKMMSDALPEEYVYTAVGGVETASALLELRFDFIFFTGSTNIGQIIYEKAAKNLTPVVLELGGKSPTIVTPSADLSLAVKRIVFGKMLNAGQTCIAPDYIYVHSSIADAFNEALIQEIKRSSYTENSEQFCNIVNEKHYKRLETLINEEKVIYGNEKNPDKNFLSPTVLYPTTWDDAVMQQEIFGPIMPILVYEDLNECFQAILSRPKPLAAYFFGKNEDEIKSFSRKLSFGGGCINDTLMHISNIHLPFGGVGQSGIGKYHGKYGFDTFSHHKSILEQSNWFDPSFKYPPFGEGAKKILRLVLNF